MGLRYAASEGAWLREEGRHVEGDGIVHVLL